MSMIGNLSRIPEDVRIALHNKPEEINQLLYPELETGPAQKTGFLSRFFGKPTTAANPGKKAVHTLGDLDTIDLDKSWHAIHFLLTGSDWDGDFPRGFLVSCGEPVGDVDVGYGPARSFTPDQVKEISAYLGQLDHSQLREKFTPEKMEEMAIYPSIWTRDEDPDGIFEYLEDGFDRMEKFIRETAEGDFALLIYIN